MGQALYRKYRSKSLDEIVGQDHITTTLAHALKQGRISHAYLFTGPRGVGKTSIARILAHEINGLPYADDTTHLDIIEIDAASNRRIDEIRDLRERVNTAPTSAKYKVYIIDEVHMLTKEAFNALLKTLEEPPAHVVFILATTEAHKLPETIISRTQRFSFRPVPTEQVVAHLKDIAKKERINIDAEALTLIAEYGEGSFRDSISLLDQVGNHKGVINRGTIETMLGLAPRERLVSLVSALAGGNATQLAQSLAESQAQGYEPAMLARQLGEYLRRQLVEGTGQLGPDELIPLLKQLLEVPASREPKHLLELILIDAALRRTDTTAAAVPATPATPASSKTSPSPAKEAKPATEKPGSKIETKSTPEAKIQATDTPPPIQTKDQAELWTETLNAIKKQHNTLYGIARMARPSFEGNVLTLALAFAFHQKRLSELKNRRIMSDTLQSLSGQKFEIHCILKTDLQNNAVEPVYSGDPTNQPPVENPAVSTISNIFGGAELLN